MEIRAKAIIFARNICRRFPRFLIAFAQIFPLLLPEYPIGFARISYSFFPKFGQKQLGIWAKAINGQIWAKAMKTRKAVGYISGKNIEVWG